MHLTRKLPGTLGDFAVAGAAWYVKLSIAMAFDLHPAACYTAPKLFINEC